MPPHLKDFREMFYWGLLENLSTNSRQQYRAWRPMYVYIVACSTQYFVAERLSKGNPFWRLRGNSQRFCIVDSYTWGNRMQRKCIVLFVWEQWLGKRGTVWHYTTLSIWFSFDLQYSFRSLKHDIHFLLVLTFVAVCSKGKFHPVTVHKVPERWYRYIYTPSLTSARWGGWSTPPPDSCPPGINPVSIV
jgi:hypothetical protein